MNQHDMTELVLTASDARDFPDYRQVLARVLLELDARMTTLEVVVNASAKNTGEGRAEEARSGSVTGPSKQPVQARPTGVREDVSVVDEGPVASRQAAPSPASPSPDAVEALARELQRAHHDGAWSDVPLWTASETSQRGYLAEARYVLSRYEPRGASVCEWCGHPWIEHSDEIGCRHPDGDGYCECLQFEPTPSPRGSTASDKLCAYCALPSHESDACPDRPEAQPLPGGEGVLKTHAIGKIGLNNCVEVADGDALVARFYGDTAQAEADRYIASRAPRATSPASPASEVPFGSVGMDVEELLDDVIGFGRDERMVRRVDLRNEIAALLASRAPRPSPQPSVEYDLYMATNRAAILSETIDSLHKMIETLAAEAGESHGVDEPVQNCAAVSRALAARDESQPSVEEMAERLHKAWIEYHGITDPWSVATDYWLALARAALSALPASEATKPASDTEKCAKHGTEFMRYGVCPLCDTQHDRLVTKPAIEAQRFNKAVEDLNDALGPHRARKEAAREAQGEPTLEECVQAYIRAHNKKCSALLHKIDALDSDARAGIAAVRTLCLASRAPSPSIEDVVDALLRVIPYKSSYETGASGLVYRADVEQVMRALFDRRIK